MSKRADAMLAAKASLSVAVSNVTEDEPYVALHYAADAVLCLTDAAKAMMTSEQLCDTRTMLRRAVSDLTEQLHANKPASRQMEAA